MARPPTNRQIIKLPHVDLKADLHIKSKVKILKKQLSYILEIMQYGSGFGWDDEKKLVIGDRETDMGWAKSREGAGPLYMKPMAILISCVRFMLMILPKEKLLKVRGRKWQKVNPPKMDNKTKSLMREMFLRPMITSTHLVVTRMAVKGHPDADTLEIGFVNISNSFAKFLEANTMNAIHKAMHHEAEVHENSSSNTDKLLEILQDLPGLTTEEAVMAIVS